MTEEYFIDLMAIEHDESWKGDNAFLGLQIIANYLDPKENTIITGGGHDEIYSVDILLLVEAGITKEDVEILNRTGWMVREEDYLAHFV